MQHQYNTPQDKRDAIVAALRSSGPPEPSFAQDGARLATAFRSKGISTEWECFRAGCYYPVSKDDRMLTTEAISLRDDTSPGFVMAFTPEPIPNKLIILVTGAKEQ